MTNTQILATQTEPTQIVIYICGHSGSVVERCANAYRARYCDDCAGVKLPKPSECLRAFLDAKGDHFGSMLGPIGAVIYARQCWFGASGMLAWSGTDALHNALEGFEPTRRVKPYIDLFIGKGL